MSFEEDDEHFEHTLLVVREVSVYKIPPRTTSGGYKCGEWLQSDKIWTGRLRVVSLKDRCEIRLEDSNSGDLFAACFVHLGQREISVESALDSSRYFVLRIEDGRGKHAFVGLGFNERNEAFDFNVALSDHEKYVSRGQEKEAGGASDENHVEIHPAVNHRLKEGETIRINVKNKPSSGTGMMSAATLCGSMSGSGNPNSAQLAPPSSGASKITPLSAGAAKSAPPAGAGAKIMNCFPPPPNDPAFVRVGSSHGSNGSSENASKCNTSPSFDLSRIENLQIDSGSRLEKPTTSSGWAAF